MALKIIKHSNYLTESDQDWLEGEAKARNKKKAFKNEKELERFLNLVARDTVEEIGDGAIGLLANKLWVKMRKGD